MLSDIGNDQNMTHVAAKSLLYFAVRFVLGHDNDIFVSFFFHNVAQKKAVRWNSKPRKWAEVKTDRRKGQNPLP